MTLMTIGQFAERTRLSPKALRLYDQLDLIVPAQVDPASGYRLYGDNQVERAVLVGLMRRLDMPLDAIARVLAAEGVQRARLLSAYWSGVEATIADRRTLMGYLQTRLEGASTTMHEIEIRTLPERRLASIGRHLHIQDTDAFFADAFARLRSLGPGIEGIAGCPFLVFYGEVSEDSDGPIELCRPVRPSANDGRPDTSNGIQMRVEPAHEEAFVRLASKEMGWPAMRSALDALEAWVAEQHRHPAAAFRQVLIADQRTASPETLVCDLSVPLR